MALFGKQPARNGPDTITTRRTVFLMILCGIVAFIVLIIQLARIMIVHHDEYESQAVENQVRETVVTASRGTIYDRTMAILAKSATVESIYISPVEMLKYGEDKAFIADNLSRILDVDYQTIMRKWERTGSWYETVKMKVEKELADQVRAFKNEYDLKSLHLIEDTKRYYPAASLGSQVIGFVGTDNYGLEGVEAVYNQSLEGTNGRIIRAATAEGTDMLFTGYEDYLDATDGSSLVLTLDKTVQYYLKKNLNQAIADNEVINGAIGIVMDVNSGEILGMCSPPDYDLNSFSTLNEDYQAKLDAEWFAGGMTAEQYDARYLALLQQQWRNRAIADTYEPGSTFKIITLASAMEAGVVTESDHFFCGGSMNVLGRDSALHCWKDAGHGDQTLAEAAQHSCNVAFTNIGIKLGAKKFYDYMEAFGFFSKTGIDLGGGEAGSIWWTPEVFEDPTNYSQLASASFGQTFNITPIQLITAVSAVANGGYLMRPHVVKQVLAADGTVEQNIEPTVVRQVLSEDTSQRVCKILESVVSAPGGTGKNASVAGYSIAGKTGTSEKVGQASEDYMVSFIGFAPAEDPQVAVLVILDSPARDSGIYISGGVMAAPVVGNIMADILPYLGVEATEGEGAAANVAMPNVREQTVDQAKASLEALGFQVRMAGDGTVVTDQAPLPGMKVAAGSGVVLYAGSDKPTEMVTVPDMVGKSYKAAKQYFEAYGLFVKTAGVAPTGSNTIVVMRQSADPGQEVSYGSVIEVGLIDTDTSIMETTG